MKNLLLFLLFISLKTFSQITPFEKSNGKETATYFEAIEFYKNLDKVSTKIQMKEMGPTGAGYPLHLVMVSGDGKFGPETWHQQNKVVIMINNGIHPGEPDGVDASMMLVRDIANGKLQLPSNVCLGIIPMYNIGGALNRSSHSRANQNGPLEYGFRGNSQNLDLNRDFTKYDSREAKTFAKIFHYLDPDILLDNHVSDGADYQYTMTLVSTQYDKLGEPLGSWLRDKFEPGVYDAMKSQGWEMTPYVNWETTGPDKGMSQFFESPRYSSGFAALFQTMSFMPETHMLKPFADRVRSTYTLEKVFIERSSMYNEEIKQNRKALRERLKTEKTFPLNWKLDSSKFVMLNFKGYEQGKNISGVSGREKMFYDKTKPYTRSTKYFNSYKPTATIEAPKAYIIPQGWYEVVDLLQLNGVKVSNLGKDSSMDVEVYQIDDYKTFGPFEKHHLNHSVKVSSSNRRMNFRKGDFIIFLNQDVNRYIVEMLEPTAPDAFFAWNFFDAVLQQKEFYSEYRWEDLAAEIIKNDASVRKKLDDKKLSDSVFADNPSAQLNFVYKNSPYYEKEHMRYPVYRVKK